MGLTGKQVSFLFSLIESVRNDAAGLMVEDDNREKVRILLELVGKTKVIEDLIRIEVRSKNEEGPE